MVAASGTIVPEIGSWEAVCCYIAPYRHDRAYTEEASMVALGTLDEVGRVVRERRRALSLSQDDLASLAGCSSRFVRALEAGKPTVRLDKLSAVLEVLGAEVEIRLRRVA